MVRLKSKAASTTIVIEFEILKSSGVSQVSAPLETIANLLKMVVWDKTGGVKLTLFSFSILLQVVPFKELCH